MGAAVNSSDSVSHGTACAAIALGANNSECSVGIAPGATLAGCPMLGRIGYGFVPGVPYPSRHVLSYGTDVNDISSNSWGEDACSSLQSRRALLSSGGICPFNASLSGSPCLAAECLTNTNNGTNGPSGDWAMDGGTPLSATECAAVISGYCASSVWHVLDLDAACHDWWHLSYVCSYSDLSELDVFALQQATATGRGGRGTVFVFSAGNEHPYEDLNYESWLFSRYTIAVGAVGKQGRHASYSTAGASLLVAAPGGDFEYLYGHWVALPGGQCGNAGVGTSYAAPVVSGVVALMLEANASLSWRDVQGILATTSQKTDPSDASWATNSVGLHHSYKYGFGLVDAHAAVTAALSWPGYGEELKVTAESGALDAVLPDDGTEYHATLSLVDGAVAVAAEHVYVYLDLNHTSRGDLRIELTSPGGMHSVLVPGPRPADAPGARQFGACTAATDQCNWPNDGVCDAPTYCLCDYADCAGRATPPFVGWPLEFGPETWTWKMTCVRSWNERATGIADPDLNASCSCSSSPNPDPTLTPTPTRHVASVR